MKHIAKQKRGLAVGLALILALSPGALGAEAIGDGRSPTVDEAYYGTLDYYGNLTQGSVVKSYVLNGAASITDYGEYEELINLTDDTQPAVNQGANRFLFGDSAPTHFYLEGKTQEPFSTLPWRLSLRYLLNGVPAKAEELAGAKGVVEIQIDALPNLLASDYARHNYTLEAMAIFNQDDILSLEAPGAQVQLLGNLRAALFLCFPGEEGHFSLRVGAEDFSFGGMTFLMVPATLSQLEEISKLSDKKEELEDNYHKLSGGMDELLDSFEGMSETLEDTAAGLDQLNKARSTISAGKQAVYKDADALRRDMESLKALLEPVDGQISATRETVSQAAALLDSLSGQVSGTREESAALLGETGELREELGELRGDLTELKRDLAEFQGDLQRFQEEVHTGKQHLSALRDALGALDESTQAVPEHLEGLKKNLNNLVTDSKELREDLEALQQYHNDLDSILSRVGTMKSSLSSLQSVLNQLAGTSLDTSVVTGLSEAQQLHSAYQAANGGGEVNEQQFFGVVLTQKNQLSDLPMLYALAAAPDPAAAGGAEAGAAAAGTIAAAAAEAMSLPADSIPVLSGQTQQLYPLYQAAKGVFAAAGAAPTDVLDSSKAPAYLSGIAGALNAALGSAVYTPEALNPYYPALSGAYAIHSAFESAKGSNDTLDFQEFMTAMLLLQSDYAATAEDTAKSLYQVYTIAQSAGTAGGEAKELSRSAAVLMGQLSTLAGQIGDLDEMLEDADELMDSASTLMSTIERMSAALVPLLEDADGAVDALQGLLSNTQAALDSGQGLMDTAKGALDTGEQLSVHGQSLLTATDGLLETAEGMLGTAGDLLEKVPGILDDVECLNQLAQTYEPVLQDILQNLSQASSTLWTVTNHAELFYDSLNLLLRTAGEELDQGTQQSLSGLSETLRKAAGSFESADGVRTSKDAITDLIEDTWRDYTGDVMDILEMDASAPAESLTDARNPSPQSVQVLLRTQEIKQEEAEEETPQGGERSTAQAAQEVPDSFWGRVLAMFAGIWSTIVGIFVH